MTFATAMPFARRWARFVRALQVSSTLRQLHRSCLAVLAASLVAAPAVAQEHEEEPAEPVEPVQAATLTLEDAISLARQNNPAYRAEANDQSVADWQVRRAYAQFLPSFDVSTGLSYTAAGTQQGFGASSDFDVPIPVSYSSSYSIRFGWNLSGATFFETSRAKADSKATAARIGAAEFTMSAEVTARYLAALGARDNVEIWKSTLESTQQALNLAQARLEVGDATRFEVSQAEVVQGRAEVGLIRAQNLSETEMLALMQQIGVSIDEDVELTSAFEVFEPTWSLDELASTALESHPQIIAARASEDAANASARAAKMNYLPRISISGGLSGFVRRQGDDEFVLGQLDDNIAGQKASCEQNNALNARLTSPMPGFEFRDCDAIQLTDQLRANALAANSQFPFKYQTSPFGASLSVSLPIWDKFSRETQLQTEQVAADDARHQRRAEELSRRTAVATNLLALKAAYRTVAIEERNVEAADEGLLLARESYRLGAGTIVELTTAQEQKVTADQGHLAAIYDFHQSLAALEAAVGRQLR